jgi:hypothetical protein
MVYACCCCCCLLLWVFCLQSIVAQDGVSGLFTRGLTTRIAANALQNICFTVLWQLGQDRLRQAAFMQKMEGGTGSSSSSRDGTHHAAARTAGRSSS